MTSSGTNYTRGKAGFILILFQEIAIKDLEITSSIIRLFGKSCTAIVLSETADTVLSMRDKKRTTLWPLKWRFGTDAVLAIVTCSPDDSRNTLSAKWTIHPQANTDTHTHISKLENLYSFVEPFLEEWMYTSFTAFSELFLSSLWLSRLCRHPSVLADYWLSDISCLGRKVALLLPDGLLFSHQKKTSPSLMCSLDLLAKTSNLLSKWLISTSYHSRYAKIQYQVHLRVNFDQFGFGNVPS